MDTIRCTSDLTGPRKPAKGLLLAAILLGALCLTPAVAQKKMVYGRVQEVGRTTALYYYTMTERESGDPHEVSMLLQSGPEGSRFGSFSAYLEDSLANALGGKAYDTRFLGRESSKIARHPGKVGSVSWGILRGYPERGKRTIFDRVLADYYLSEERDSQPSWRPDKTAERSILGYKCHSAVTELYGREWRVWYTMDIDDSVGPWLLSGLPGVVIEAESLDGDYHFILRRIERRETPILFPKHSYTEAPRDRILRERAKYLSNPAVYIQSTDYGKDVSGVKGNARSRVFNPIRKIKIK